MIVSCHNKIQRFTFKSMNWRCRSTKNIYNNILNLEIYYIVPKKLADFF